MIERLRNTIYRNLPLCILSFMLVNVCVYLLFWAIGFEQELSLKAILPTVAFSVLGGLLLYFHIKQERELKNKKIVSKR